jgi:hypothetical protein
MVQQVVEIEKKFVSSLSTSQRQEFATCKLQDVVDAIKTIQHEQGTRKKLQNLARIQPFIEAMDGYEKVVDRFLNITIGLGYIWVCYIRKRYSGPGIFQAEAGKDLEYF